MPGAGSVGFPGPQPSGGGGGDIEGSGTANKVAKFTDATTIGDSAITEDGSTVTSTLPLVAPRETLTQGTLTSSTPAISHTATWNNGAVTFTNIFSNVTSTASAANSLLVDLQVGGASKFAVAKDGGITIVGGLATSGGITAGAGQFLQFGNRSYLDASADGVFNLHNNAGTGFSQLVLGNSTTAFPSLKRSGTVVAFRLGDDSADSALSASTATLSALASDATHTDNTVCADTGTGLLYKGSGAAGICLGTSSERFKHTLSDIKEGLSEVLKLHPRNFFYKAGYGDDGNHLQYGFTAEEVAEVLPNVARNDAEGKPQSVDYGALFPVLTRAIQELSEKVDAQVEMINSRLETLCEMVK